MKLFEQIYNSGENILHNVHVAGGCKKCRANDRRKYHNVRYALKETKTPGMFVRTV
ncbi:hypothetical protein D1BOALGB6SA_1359 [Olavius sp. associated proteobacterium Delta 1]|nr:hypothetical protein D1BOALGB6SA_1359 [Olavius sp. associated proteobacterium Delta 1]